MGSIGRTTATAAVVLLVVLMPAAVSSATVTASIHTTSSDFSNGTLNNLVIEGTGDGASVALPAPFDAYNPVYTQGDGDASSFHQLVGDTSGNDLVNTSVQIQPNATGTIESVNPYVSTEYVDYDLNVDIYAIQESVDSDVQEGSLLKSDWTPSSGSGRKSINLDTALDVQDGETWTISFVSTNTNNDGSIDGIDVARDLSGGTDWIYSSDQGFRDGYLDIEYQYQADSQNGTYTGATHDVDDATQAFANVTLHNASIDYEWQSYNPNLGWQTQVSGTWSSSANHTVSLPSTLQNEWRLKTEFNVTGPNPTAQLHDEGVQFDGSPPSIDNSSAEPPDGAGISNAQQTFEIDITDPDFGTVQGEQVTAELFVDGNSAGTDTLTSNGTASVTETISIGGQHSYYWQVSDAYGLQSTSQQFSFKTPANLTIYNESSPTEVIDNATVELRFYFGDGGVGQVVNRTAKNGTINMTGLPSDQSFIAVARADGYITRRVFVPSLYETQSIFMLPTSAQSADVIFTIQDFTGNYDQDTSVLEVQRALNGTWETVLGDYFGANGEFPGQLAYNVRHRLIIRNTATGDNRTLGAFTPISSSGHTITISPNGTIQVEGAATLMSVNPSVGQLKSADGQPMTISIDGHDSDLKNWSLAVYYVNSTHNVTLFSDSGGSASSIERSVSLPLKNKTNGTVQVRGSWFTQDNVSGSYSQNFGTVTPSTHQFSILDGITAFVGLIPADNQDTALSFLAMTVTIIGTASVASVLRLPTEMSGAVAVMFVATFAVVGWVGYNLLFVTVAAWASISYLRRRY